LGSDHILDRGGREIVSDFEQVYEFRHARAQFEQPVELVGRVCLELADRVE